MKVNELITELQKIDQQKDIRIIIDGEQIDYSKIAITAGKERAFIYVDMPITKTIKIVNC